MTKLTRIELEGHLDGGRVFAHMRNGNWWRLRRNGRTQTWKTRPMEFRIPFKCGLKECGALTHHDFHDGELSGYYRIQFL